MNYQARQLSAMLHTAYSWFVPCLAGRSHVGTGHRAQTCPESTFRGCRILARQNRVDDSQLSIDLISKLWGLLFTNSNYTSALRIIWTCKKVSNAKLWLEKAIKMYFDSERHFEFRRIRDIRVRDIESRLYMINTIWAFSK